ncbi:hypothetical protein [Winogradskyella rapida]|uniref:Outer membrane protein beta-barrel domain-containing protein n=1 Tax=Winogradskyella rapida TaxID=549701 RepID=A0ABW3KS81_9FLAO
MKKLLLLAFILTLSFSSFAQRYNEDWTLSFGVNALNTLGTQSPINSPDDWSFQTPISAAIEFSWVPNLAIEQAITFNGFKESSRVDFGDIEENYNYVSLDTNAKYYFRELIFGRGRHLSWFDIYANAGLGFFHIEDSNVSFNLGGGVLFWLNRNQTFGIRAQTLAKFAFNNSDAGYENNHYQYHLQAVFRL